LALSIHAGHEMGEETQRRVSLSAPCLFSGVAVSTSESQVAAGCWNRWGEWLVSKLLRERFMVRHLRRGFIWWCVGLLVAGLTACASSASSTRDPDKLFFAIRVEQDGRAVGAPRLLGFEGRRLFAEKWTPGAPLPDYRLLLQPEEEGPGYGISLDLELPSGRSRSRVGLLHGEERTITLDPRTRLTLMVMRVDSPEFRALMRTSVPKDNAARGAI
jgi:hypothetical protein